jgi:8-oxo-dGTP diphosphatase
MTTVGERVVARQVYFHDAAAPRASRVVPSVFVVARRDARLLLVRRCDSGMWELPGGRVDVGEDATDAAVREVAEEAGVTVEVTGLVGVFTDPGHVVRSREGEVRQQFALVLRAQVLRGVPHPDLKETSEAAWVPTADLADIPMEGPARLWISAGLDAGQPPHLG